MSSFALGPRPTLRRSRVGRASISLGLGLLLGTTLSLSPVSAQQAPATDRQVGAPTDAASRGGMLGCTQASSRFGRMFPNLPAASWSSADLHALATRVMADEEEDPTPETEVDDEENLAIDAGYTYVGQFIDHDLTLDPRPDDLTTPVDPTTLQNFRTPAFDLDSVYGGGPSASPQLYQSDGMHLRVGVPLSGNPSDPRAVDLPRDKSTGQALLGDPRNDENRIVAGLHTVFLRFHNLIVDRLRKAHPDWSPSRILDEARHQVRAHYQWAVLFDFLPTVVGRDVASTLLPSPDRVDGARPQFFNPCTVGTPVEFSVAAYRFGHSMVRAVYRINSTVPRLPVFTLTNDPTQDLGGFRPSPTNFAIDWSFFFLMDGQQRVVGKPQPAYKMDNSLVFPLSLLPLPATGSGPKSLAERNLLRSVQLGLPSGQAVARQLGVQPLRDDQILIGKATGDAVDATAITRVAPGFAGKAPLWTYVLAEATASAFNVHDGRIDGPQVKPMRLGAVGGRIVAETFVGFLAADTKSLLYEPTFRPDPAFSRNGRFGFADLIRAAN